MNEIEQAHFRRLLLRRAKRLVSFIEANVPTQLVANEVGLVGRAAWGFCPEEYGRTLATYGQMTARRSAGLCASCGVATPAGAAGGVCVKCDADMEAEAKED